jgi:hypothetical protein
MQFYFSNAAISPRDIDLKQFKRVEDFKNNKVAKAGVLYSSFEDLVQLKLSVRTAIISDIFDILEREVSTSSQTASRPGLYRDLDPYNGLKNLSALVSDNPLVAMHLLTLKSTVHMNDMTAEMREVTSLITSFSASMVVATKEAEVVSSRGKNPKNLIKKVEQVFFSIEKLNAAFTSALPSIESHFDQSISAFHRIAIMKRQYPEDGPDGMNEVQPALKTLRETYISVIGQCKLFADNLPEIEFLGPRWGVNRLVVIALVQDMVEFLARAVARIHELEELIS